MKALSLIQPWASLIVAGLKRVETRSWSTAYRGMIAIHASKSKEVVRDFGEVEQIFDDAGMEVPAEWPKEAKDYPLGKIVAVVRLADCKKMDEKLIAEQTIRELGFGAWSPGRCAWFLEDVSKLEIPVPCKGARSLWDVPKEIEAALGGGRGVPEK